MPDETPSAYEQVTRERLTALEERFDSLQARLNGNLEKMWEAIDRLRDRPPVWTVTVITTAGTIIGALAMWVINHLAR